MPKPQPYFFGPSRRPLFGWLHAPETSQASDVGLVICSPLGYDGICSHRTTRHLALSAATRGIPSLRFDYDGTGDSAGDDMDPGRVAAWLDSVGAAVDSLRSRTGVRTVCILGIRLGASLALLASQDRSDVSGVVLINPVITGRKYLRELRALAATSSAPAPYRNADADIQEAAGFVTTLSTRESLGQISLDQSSLRSVPEHVLLLDRTDLPVDTGLASLLSQKGSTVDSRPMPGYADMLRDAQAAIVPEDTIRDVLDWLDSWNTRKTGEECRPATATCVVEWPADGATRQLRESAVDIGVEGGIFGIVTEAEPRPAGQAAMAGTPVLLLLNAGAVHHIGPNRLYVQLARDLAARGFKVLRLDLPGLGDSPAVPGQPEHQIYPDRPETLVSQAVDFARTQLGAGQIHCAGICSGGYHSLKTAVAGVPLNSVLVINPLTFFWKPDMSLSPPAFRDTAEIMRYKRTGLSAASLRKLLTGKVDLLNLSGILVRHALRRLRSMARRICRSAGLSLGDDLAAELRQAHKQGTRMHFLFSRTDPGHSLLLDEAGGEVSRLMRLGALTIQFIDNADHTFTPLMAQLELRELIATILASQPTFLS